MPPHMSGQFEFQAECARFLIRQGRGAAFLDTGLGKTSIEHEFCRQAAVFTGLPSLLLTPLAVARQIEAEGRRWGYECGVIRDQSEVRPGTNICNYDRMDSLNAGAFGCVSLDESGILKNFMGSTTRRLIAAFAETPFRLCATATPAPNDHMELGTHSEFLGVMPRADMLLRWFINDTSEASQTWRLKRHAVGPFWDWVASWARMAETPADLGYDASGFALPPLKVHRHRAIGEVKPPPGLLFGADVSATTMFDVKRQTTASRADAVAALTSSEPKEPWVIWCDTDIEADALMARIPGAREVRGSHPTDRKEATLYGFSNGEFASIVIKPAVGALGLNWQHCSHMVFVGRTFSYERWYQCIRRCWRFGQTRPVHVHVIVAEGEDQIGRVIDRKAESHTEMKTAMADAMRRDRATTRNVKISYNPQFIGRIPTWLRSCAV